ncbi:MAG: sulfur carrier protein ThiS [Polyangiaceae bacterium]|jgi:thiamine biosynthesis protein ThiS|nr:sulfur carrier protein ThiS [Polyangiaceae bacterium]
MNLIVNGERVTLSDGNTVGTLLAQLELAAVNVAVVVNGHVVAGAERAGRALSPGDEIELLTLAGGG